MRQSVLLFAALLFAAPLPLRADSFDDLTSHAIARAAKADGAREAKQLPLAQLVEHDHVLKDTSGAVLVVRTNDDRWARLLVQVGRQRVNAERALPVVLIERFVTFREGTERTVQTSGKSVTLYPGYRFSLDRGQIVPEELAADLRLATEGDKVVLETVKDARLYLLTALPAGATPVDTDRVHAGEPFQPRFFNGTYKLYDDGRRSGTLTLKVGDEGQVSGSFASDKDGQNYEVEGKLGPVKHAITFTIRFPRTEEVFQGWLFTGDGKALAGTSRLLEREAGFYAVRVESK